jgi:multidrug efflux pump subunit AcrA (membrane-fusion protein)
MGPKIVTGRVIGPDGRPIAGASVMFARGPVALPDIAQITDTKGRFALTAPANGTYRVLVNAPDLASVEHEVEVGGNVGTILDVIIGPQR